jgi:hypothetical protein
MVEIMKWEMMMGMSFVLSFPDDDVEGVEWS